METSGLLWSFFLFAICDEWVQCLAAEHSRGSPESEDNAATENTAVATTVQYFRRSRSYRRGGDHHSDIDEDSSSMDMDHVDPDETKALSTGKVDYWGGYYDFLINEGSYKFWAVFQLATAALLIYSGFAALYYAKVNPPTTDDYEDYFLRRRRRKRDVFLGLEPETFQRILDAVFDEFIQPHQESG